MQQVLPIIDELVTTIQALLPNKEEAERSLDKKVRLEFNYNSNSLEGNSLTYSETELLLIFGKTTGHHELREYEEMKAHDEAFKTIKEWAADKEKPLTEEVIKNLNEILLEKSYWKNVVTGDGHQTRRQIKIGEYKEYPNQVRLQNGEIFNYASPAETPAQMAELMAWYRDEQEKNELHPVAIAALLHYRFVRIHPFDGGNGRLSRLLMNYVLLQHGLPPVIIKSAGKEAYLLALNEADKGDEEAFVNYIAGQLVWSLQLFLRAAKGESLDEPGDMDRKLSLLQNKQGEDVNTEVELKYGEKGLEVMIENTMRPLAEEWENQLKKFEPFFDSRDVFIEYGTVSVGDKTLENLVNTFASSLHDFLATVSLPASLIISAYFTGLKSKDDKKEMPAGQIIFTFYENNYEISYTDSDRKLNKLYHQHLNEEDIATITESLGNWFYNRLVQAVGD